MRLPESDRSDQTPLAELTKFTLNSLDITPVQLAQADTKAGTDTKVVADKAATPKEAKDAPAVPAATVTVGESPAVQAYRARQGARKAGDPVGETKPVTPAVETMKPVAPQPRATDGRPSPPQRDGHPEPIPGKAEHGPETTSEVLPKIKPGDAPPQVVAPTRQNPFATLRRPGDQPATPAATPKTGDQPATPAATVPKTGDQPATPAATPKTGDQPATPAATQKAGDQPSTPVVPANPFAKLPGADKPATPAATPKTGDQPATPAATVPKTGDQPA
ncbi:MAG: hypothetical protein K2W95_01720, partial [Candidatus Obscuribacterales bacterium]|nr:hypothetical protein [Candidatus Obscuribacterales bacterium]